MARLSWIRAGSLCYTLVLTVFLLAPDPAGLVGLRRVPGLPGGRMVHFVFFTLLAALAWLSRWPVRGWVLGLGLVAYAAGTELLQTFVPPRTVELADVVENVLGLATGTWLVWIVRRQASGKEP